MCYELDSSPGTGWLKRTVACIAVGVAAALATTAPAFAEQESESVSRFMEEVVVQARKREEELQDVPLSITAFNGDTIERMYGENLSEFSKYTPGEALNNRIFS